MNNLTLEQALADQSQTGTFHLYRLEVGGETYIGFTSQAPEKRLEQHLQSAREGSENRVHGQLRKFGFYHSFEVIKTFSHEVEALLNEIIEIKKQNATLNSSPGGEGSKYIIVLETNSLGEEVYAVALRDDITKRQKHDEYLKTISNGDVLFDFFDRVKNPLDSRALWFVYNTHPGFAGMSCNELIKFGNGRLIHNSYGRNVIPWNEYDFGFDREDFKAYIDGLYEHYEAESKQPCDELANIIKEDNILGSAELYKITDINDRKITTQENGLRGDDMPNKWPGPEVSLPANFLGSTMLSLINPTNSYVFAYGRFNSLKSLDEAQRMKRQGLQKATNAIRELGVEHDCYLVSDVTWFENKLFGRKERHYFEINKINN
jgi:hypothetical protein